MTSEAVLARSAPTGTNRAALFCAYAIVSLCSISGNFLYNGLAFYTSERFGFAVRDNLYLAAIQGAFCTVGALAASRIARRFGRTPALIATSVMMIAILLMLILSRSPAMFFAPLMLFMVIITMNWPMLESLVTEGCNANRMSRRVTLYNLNWATMGVGVIAIYGTVLTLWRGGALMIPLICQVICLGLSIVLYRTHRPASPQASAHAHVEVEPELLRCRRLALWLSRISIPASFLITNSLMAMFSSFPASREMGLALSTLVASLWFLGRFACFGILGCNNWWHTRPRFLLGAAAGMFAAFLLIALPAARLGPFAQLPLSAVITIIAVAELALGLMVGFIYSASLYFGMVLSDGSTEHAGYHEALISIGVVLGPGVAAIVQQVSAGQSHLPAILAVSSMMVLTLAWATRVAFRRSSP